MKYVPVESGEAQRIEQVWEQYFADPSQWWDNRVNKVSLGLPVDVRKLWKTMRWLFIACTRSWAVWETRSILRSQSVLEWSEG